MYNTERKEKYLSQCGYSDTTKEMIRKIFNEAEKTEIQYDFDLSEFQQNEKYQAVISLFQSLNLKSKETLETVRLFLSDYANWCLKEELIHKNYYVLEETKEAIESII